MKTRSVLITALVALAVLVGAGSASYVTKVYIEQGGAKQVVADGGEIEIQSGGTLDIQSGATFSIASSSFDPTAYVPVTKAGQQTITATGAGNDAIVTGADAAAINGGGGTGATALADATAATLQSPDNANSVVVDDTGVWIEGAAIIMAIPLAIPATATLPTCDTTIAPTGYYAFAVDTTGPDLCQCNGSAWTPVDGSGTCA